MPSFEPLEILYTIGLFWFVLDLELRMIHTHFDVEPKTFWLGKIRAVFIQMLDGMRGVQTYVQNFEKGFIIHREYMVRSENSQVLYSVNLDKESKFPGRRKPEFTHSEFNEFRKNLTQRFLRETE